MVHFSLVYIISIKFVFLFSLVEFISHFSLARHFSLPYQNQDIIRKQTFHYDLMPHKNALIVSTVWNQDKQVTFIFRLEYFYWRGIHIINRENGKYIHIFKFMLVKI